MAKRRYCGITSLRRSSSLSILITHTGSCLQVHHREASERNQRQGARFAQFFTAFGDPSVKGWHGKES
ncbi:hypothetical protein SO802_028853 [Lithocarpus litseifolius]|uniref:Secreted protein n=1 Tax=Lithocarpus litseifolius TaxID=425828 RepID=A0AAW2BRP3_9ROSI